MTQYDSALPRRNVVRLKALQRASRALDVIPLTGADGHYHVASGTTPGRYYEVTINPETLEGQCTCPWAQHGGVNCKHVLAVLRAHYAGQGALSFWASPDEARRQHRKVIAGTSLLATVRR